MSKICFMCDIETDKNLNDNPEVILCSEDCARKYDTLNDDIQCVVARHINGISLNEYEFLLDAIDGEILVFNNFNQAKEHLLQQSLSEDEINNLRILDYVKLQNGEYQDVS